MYIVIVYIDNIYLLSLHANSFLNRNTSYLYGFSCIVIAKYFLIFFIFIIYLHRVSLCLSKIYSLLLVKNSKG